MTTDVEQPSTAPGDDLAAAAELLRMTSAAWVAQAIAVAARLRLADLLEDGAKRVDEVAAATGTHAPSLFRLFRALAGVGIFAEDGEGRFELTPWQLRCAATSRVRYGRCARCEERPGPGSPGPICCTASERVNRLSSTVMAHRSSHISMITRRR